MNIQQAADAWLLTLESRKRHRAKPATLATFRSYVRVHIGPAIGQQDIASFSNAAMRAFVALLADKKLAAKTINEVSGAVRASIASVVDPQTGEKVYPRVWNADFIDAPEIANQSQPSVTVSELEAALAASDDFTRALIALAATSGARIGELQALRIGQQEKVSYWNREIAAIEIKTSIWRAQEQSPKTSSAIRTIEIAKPVNDLLTSFAGERKGFLFGNGSAAHVSVLRDRLDKVLPHKGFHSFRRFRATALRGARPRCPEDLVRYWLGHAGESITDIYSKLSSDEALRRTEADRIGIGFRLP